MQEVQRSSLKQAYTMHQNSNKNMDTIKYETPAISLVYLTTEGVLCQSGTEDIEIDNGEW